jgi:Dopey, N-terminal
MARYRWLLTGQDMISFLTRLQKLLQTFKMFTRIPQKLILSKRLAQCLNPALPPRVHTKVLQVYATIFENQGQDLVLDLNIWSMGLFSFTVNATMAVRPVLMELYEKYFVNIVDGMNDQSQRDW